MAGRHKRTSRYLTMRDGVRLAVDVHVPAAAQAGARVPAIVHQTRYFRSVALRGPLERTPLVRLLDGIFTTRRRFLDAGYAWVDVCCRGSGASFGTRPHPWTDDEIEDGREVVDHLVGEPWCSGRIGTTGISYSGTTAELLAGIGHPAVRAAAPRFSLFDVYPDIAFPGGLHLRSFTEGWARFNRLLDEDDLASAFGHLARHTGRGFRETPSDLRALLWRSVDTAAGGALLEAFVRAIGQGVRPVDGDRGRALVRAAVASHRDNADVHVGALHATFRDDDHLLPHRPDAGVDAFSPHLRAARLRDASVPVYGYSGWLDGAYQLAAVKRHLAVPNAGSRLRIGPWDHGGAQDVSPFTKRRDAEFDHDAELLAFFDHHLKERPSERSTAGPVDYYTMGAERWRTAPTWPPPGLRSLTWHLTSPAALSVDPPSAEDTTPWRPSFDAGTGTRSRWNTLLGTAAPVGYPDGRAMERHLLAFTSAPLPDDLEVTGHPVLHLHVAADAADCAVFAYLQDVDPSGRPLFVTEGLLRALHRLVADPPGSPPSTLEPTAVPGVPYRTFRRAAGRPLEPGRPNELAFDLLPTSWLFRRGHRIRIALAGADRDHFAPVARRPPSLVLHHGPAFPSRLVLPVVPVAP